MSCYPKLTWPYCNPGAGVYECSDPALKTGCCLSAPTTEKTKSNCPAGWESNPKNSSEWCTDSFGIFSKSKYRHKCKRKSCPNSMLDPSTNCATCTNSMLDPKSDCKTCLSDRLAPPFCDKCANQDLAYPDCATCINSSLVPPKCTTCFNSMLSPNSGCTVCSNSLFAAPECTTCSNPLLEYPDCTSCANSDQDIRTQCATCTNPLLKYPGCVECAENPLLAPQECASCLDPDRVAPDCEKCRQGMFLNPANKTCVMCGETDCAQEGCGCAQGNCLNDTCNCITTQAPLSTGVNRATGERAFINMFPSTNTGFIYAPKEMFESSAPVGSYGYQFYVYGFWGFIQIYDHAIIAMDNVSYNSKSNNPAVDQRVNRTAGVWDKPGYTNAVKLQDARFNGPKGLALDKTVGYPTWRGAGKEGYTRPTLFVADHFNHCIRMISVTVAPWPGGTPVHTSITTTLTGSLFTGFNGPQKQDFYVNSGYKDGNFRVALFNSPTGLDFDSNGALYVADTENNAIRKIVIKEAEVNLQYNLDYTGTVTTLQVPGFPGLQSPTGVLFHNGFLYVCDSYTIYKIDVLNPKPNPKFDPSSNVLIPEIHDVQVIAGGYRLPPPPDQDLSQVQNPYGMVFKGNNLLFSDATGVKILVNAGQMPPVIRPAPLASFPAANRAQALMEYQGNIVVGLKDTLAVQISGKDCTCFPDIPGNC